MASPGTTRLAWCAAVCAVVLALGDATSADEPSGADALARAILDKAGAVGGICSLPTGDTDLAFALARHKRLVVHVLQPTWESVLANRRKAADQGLLGKWLYFDRGSPQDIPLADNYADLVVVPDARGELPIEEIARILVPGGKAFFGGANHDLPSASGEERWKTADGLTWYARTKSPRHGGNTWSHYNCGSDNNLFAQDDGVQAPFQTQFLERPFYVASPSVTLAAGGRLFVLSGLTGAADFAQTAATIYCRSGYNGRLLWTRPNKWTRRQSSRMGLSAVATEGVFYLAEDSAVSRVDARTGEDIGKLEFPGLETPLRWIALSNNTLYAIDSDPKGTTLVAADPQTGQVRWSHKAVGVIESRQIAVLDPRLVYCLRSGEVVCHWTQGTPSGERVAWRNDTAELRAVLSPPTGKAPRWSSFGNAPPLVLTQNLVFVQSPVQPRIAVLSTADGKLVRTLDEGLQRRNLNVVYDGKRDRVLAVLQRDGKPLPAALDPKTAEPLRDPPGRGFPLRASMCARMVATSRMSFTHGPGGLGVRTACQSGAAVANGMIYSISSGHCRCTQSLNGQFALSSVSELAAPIRLGKSAPEVLVQDRDELEVEPLTVDVSDWPEYRANPQRTASTPAAVPSQPVILWQAKRQGSLSPPVTAANRIFLGQSDGQIVCLDAADGKRLWSFPTGGPVRLPPTIWQGRALVGSGDGYLYCLEAATGRPLWRFRPATPRRLVNLYGSLCDVRPVHTGALVHDGVVYAGAGMHWLDGTCLFAVDARTGEPKWENAQLDSRVYQSYPAMTGDLTFARGKLYLAGKAHPSPACYDAVTGELILPPTRVTAGLYPVGREAMIWRDRWMVYGGNYLFAPPGPIVRTGFSWGRPNTLMFFLLDDVDRRIEAQPFGMTAVPPALDEKTFVAATYMDGHVYAWDADALEVWLKEILAGKAKGYERSDSLGGKGHEHYRLPDRDYRRPRAPEATQWGPLKINIQSLVLAANMVVCTASDPTPGNRRLPKATSDRAGDDRSDAPPPIPWGLLGLDRATGATLWQLPLPGIPAADGLCIDRQGRIAVCLEDGQILVAGK